MYFFWTANPSRNVVMGNWNKWPLALESCRLPVWSPSYLHSGLGLSNRSQPQKQELPEIPCRALQTQECAVCCQQCPTGSQQPVFPSPGRIADVSDQTCWPQVTLTEVSSLSYSEACLQVFQLLNIVVTPTQRCCSQQKAPLTVFPVLKINAFLFWCHFWKAKESPNLN